MNDPIWQPGMTLEELEKLAILKAFRIYGGVQTRTALALGITTRTLYNKLTSYGEKGISDESGDGDGRDSGTGTGRDEDSQAKQGPSRGLQTQGGVRLESASQASEKHAMPVRERQEIQGMSSRQATARTSGKGR